MSVRTTQQVDAQRRIRRSLAGVVPDGEKVLRSFGSVTLAAAQAPSGLASLTVFTKARPIADALAASPMITPIAGGSFTWRSELSLIDGFAETFEYDLAWTG